MTSKIGPYNIPFDPGEMLCLIHELGNIIKRKFVQVVSFFMVDDKPCVEIDDGLMANTQTHEITEISQRHLCLKKDGVDRNMRREDIAEEDV